MITRTESISSRGLKTSWLRSGTPGKPILLFLHGYPDSPDTWEFQVQHFKDDFDILCPFVRGAGPSEKAKEVRRYGLESVGLDILAILKKADPSQTRPIYCVGHDLGAVHASHLAHLLGDRLEGLVLMNGLPLPQMVRRMKLPRQQMKSWYIYLMQLPLLPESVARFFPRALLAVAHRLGEVPERSRLEVSEVKDCVVYTVNQYRAFARAIPRYWRGQEPKIDCPVLILWGDRDAFLVTPTADEFKPFASRFTTRILEGNHWIHREQPKRVNRLLEEFFREGNA